MNYNSKIYAVSFCEIALRAKTDAEIDKYINNFLKLVRLNRDSRKLNDIVLSAERIICQKTGLRKFLIESARPLSEENEKTVNFIVGKSDIIEKKIDPKLVAGVKITINDELQLDNSFSKKIKKILDLSN